MEDLYPKSHDAALTACDSGTKRSRSAPARSSESPSSNGGGSQGSRVLADGRHPHKSKEEPLELKKYDVDDVERMQRRPRDETEVRRESSSWLSGLLPHPHAHTLFLHAFFFPCFPPPPPSQRPLSLPSAVLSPIQDVTASIAAGRKGGGIHMSVKMSIKLLFGVHVHLVTAAAGIV